MVETLKARAKRLMADVPDEYAFRCVNGHVLHNLRELEAELITISDQDYSFHVNPQKNDFARWVKDVIRDENLTKNLLKASGRAQAAKNVNNRLSDLAKL
jgi:predicted metal-dependent HD superfamily phosphohydrolase